MKKFYLLIFIALFISQLAYSQQYADSVVYAMLGGPNNTYTDLNSLLGPPDVGNNGPEVYVALGGGFVVLDMGVYIINGVGADLKIYEAGISYPPLGGDEPFYLLGNEDNALTVWRYLGSCSGDICEIDLDSLNVNNIRYIAIFDAVPEAATTHTWTTPGADIDAIEALNYQTTSVDISNQNMNPDEYNLFQNFPNPFNPNTTIEYYVPSPAYVKLIIYNSLGEVVRVLIDEFKTAGRYSIGWYGIGMEGDKVTSGTYFYQLHLGDRIESKKMILLK